MMPSVNPTIFKVKRPDGQIWDIPEENLDKAISLGGEVMEDYSVQPMAQQQPIDASPSMNVPQQITPNEQVVPEQNPSEKMFKIKRPDGQIWDIPQSNLEKAKQLGGEVIQDLSLGDRALQFASGAASLVGAAGDITNKFIAAPSLNLVGGATELAAKGAGLVSPEAEEFINKGAEKVYQARDYYGNTHLAEQAEHAVENVAGKDISPHDTTGRILKNTGEFSVPLSNVTKGAKTVVEFGKALGKHLGISAAGGIAPETTYSEKGTVLNGIEELVQTLSFMITADNALSTSKKDIINNIGNLINKTFGKSESASALNAVKETKKELGHTKDKLIGKVLSLGSKPTSDFNAVAKSENIDLPFNIALGGRFKNFLANTVFQSLFTNKAYHAVVEGADASMIKAVRDKVEDIGSFTTFEGASSNTADFLKKEENTIGKEVKKLYGESDALINEKDKIKLPNLTSAIEDILPKISAPDPSDDMIFVAKRISKMGKAWGLLPDLTKYENAPEILIEQIKKNWKQTSKEIPVSEVIVQLKALHKHLNYEKNIKGVKAFVNQLIGAVEKDLSGSPNQEFLKKRKVASNYFKENEADRIRTDMARSIMTGEVPKEAIKFMGSVGQIRKLENILGDSSNAKEIMGSLKRAKGQDMVLDNLIDNVGTISYAKFATLFNKKSSNQALLKEVLGESYEPLKKLSGVSQEFVKSGKLFGNPSKTTLAARDMKGVVDLIKSTFNNFGTTATGYAVGGPSGALAGALEPAAIYFFSKHMANKNFINNAVKYAEAKRLGQKGEKIFADRVSRFVEDNAKKITDYPQILNHMFSEYAENKRNKEKERAQRTQ